MTVISPKPYPEIVKLSEERVIGLNRREYEAGDLKGGGIAFACTDVKMVNRKVADEARKAGVLVNVADDPEQSDFIIPSFFRRGNLTVAVSTSGVSPALAKKIRTRLEQGLGEEYALLLSLVGGVRLTIREKGAIASAEAWQGALDLDLLVRLAKAGQWKKAKTFLLNELKAAEKRSRMKKRNL